MGGRSFGALTPTLRVDMAEDMYRWCTRAISYFGLAAAVLLSPIAACAQEKAASGGSHIFASNCAACHGSDGRGGERAPNIATVRRVISLSDDDLLGIVKRGIPGTGMPPFGYMGDESVANVVGYLRELQGRGASVKVAGDPVAGRAVFYGKGGCSSCHMMRGDGGFIGEDLSTYGEGLSAAKVRAAIVSPDTNLEPTSTVVEVRTLGGKRVSGVLRSEDNFSLTLQTEDGQFHMLSKADLSTVRHTAHSLMPRDYATRLSPKEMEDLVSYLISAASMPHPLEKASKKGGDDDDN